mmetsp:Transcript_74758/g.230952  ORF Transcript_74758/g.230952 Transcript_74758/m.230952 type:complete len:226 (-) Transcript_74758:1251-1928(-)
MQDPPRQSGGPLAPRGRRRGGRAVRARGTPDRAGGAGDGGGAAGTAPAGALRSQELLHHARHGAHELGHLLQGQDFQPIGVCRLPRLAELQAEVALLAARVARQRAQPEVSEPVVVPLFGGELRPGAELVRIAQGVVGGDPALRVPPGDLALVDLAPHGVLLAEPRELTARHFGHELARHRLPAPQRCLPVGQGLLHCRSQPLLWVAGITAEDVHVEDRAVVEWE